MLEKSPLKSTQLLLDQIENHLQRCFFILYLGYCWEWALSVSQDDEPQVFGCSKRCRRQGMEIDYWFWAGLSRGNKTRGPCVLPEDRNTIPVKWIFKKSWMLRVKFVGRRRHWCAEDLCKEKELTTLRPLHQLLSLLPLDCWLLLLLCTSWDWFSWMSLWHYLIQV